MKLKLLGVVAALTISGFTLWLYRYNLSSGPNNTLYDITLTDSLKASHAGKLMFGSHEFLAGSFIGNAVNIGVSVPIPDTAIQEFREGPKRDPKYFVVDENGWNVYKGPYIPDPPPRFTKIPVRSRLPPRHAGQKYHFHFTIFPKDSVQLVIQVLDQNDCSHIDKFAATAHLREGPCSW